jgi:large repetitive protein
MASRLARRHHHRPSVEGLEIRLHLSAISFGNSVSYPVGDGPASVAVADFNGDGRADLVTANSGDDTVSVLLGNGDGTFQSARTFSVGNYPDSVAVGDFNGDGRMDIVTANKNSDTVSVLLGNGDGTFEPAETYATGGGYATSVAVGDFNGDGRSDIVVANYQAGTVSVLMSNANGTFKAAQTFAVNSSFVYSVAVGDFNGDGRMDIATANLNHSVSILLGNGDGTFQSPHTFAAGAAASSIAVGDFNGDGKLDIAVANAATTSEIIYSSVNILLGNGDGTFEAPQSFKVLGKSDSIAVADFNGDGALDVVKTNVTYRSISVLAGNGDGTLQGEQIFNTEGSSVTSVAVGDFTGDGRMDIVTTDDSSPGAVDVLLNTTPTTAPTITSGTSAVFQTGTADSIMITTTGVPQAALTEDGLLPPGVSFHDNGNGAATIFGTPAPGSGGVYPLTLNADNGVTPNASQSFTLEIDEAPQITSGNNFTFAVGQDSTFTITAGGFPVPSLSEDGGLPAGITFVANGGGTAMLTGIPAADSVGNYTLTLTASNTVSSDHQIFALTVAESGSAPAFFSGGTATFTTGTAGSFTVTANGSPTPSLNKSGTLPQGVSFVDNGNGTATLSGTPAAGTGGIYSLTFTAVNNISSTPQSFTLTVDQAPAFASADSATFVISSAGTFTISATGFPTDVLMESGTLPIGVSFQDNGNGTASLFGTPAAGTSGIYPLTITAANGVSPAGTQTFTLMVGQPPAFTSADSATFVTSTTGTFTISATGLPTDALMESGALPTGVSFQDNGNGSASLFGAPAAGTSGIYPLTFTAANGVSPAAVQTFSLIVVQPPAITSASDTTFTTGTAVSFTITTTGFPTDVLAESGALPVGVSFTDNGDGTATLAGTPDPTSGGVYVLTLTADNGVTPSAMQTFTLTVDEPPAITSAAAVKFAKGFDDTFTITATGTPTPSLTEMGALPPGLTLTDDGNGTATLSGTPAGAVGAYDLTLTAGNGLLPNATQSFTLKLAKAKPPAITSDSAATFIAGTTGSFAVTATGLPVAALTESGALPGGISFVDNANGTATLSGTPADGTGGIYPLALKAKNGDKPNARQTLTLTLDEQPSITSTDTTSFTIGTLSKFTVTTTGFPTPAIVENGTLAAGITFIDKGNGTAKLRGTPAAGSAGSYVITLKAKNGVSPKFTQSFTLVVTKRAVSDSVSPATSGIDAIAASGASVDAVILSSAGDDTLLA